jgi:hypothetical protein
VAIGCHPFSIETWASKLHTAALI